MRMADTPPRALHALIAGRDTSDGFCRVYLMRLRKDQRASDTVADLLIDRAAQRLVAGRPKQFLSALGGAALWHFDQAELRDQLDAALVAAGFIPLDNPWGDLAKLAHARLSRRQDPIEDCTLEALAHRHGIPARLRGDPEHSAEAAVRLMADLFQPFFLPCIRSPLPSGLHRDAPAAFVLAPDDLCALAADRMPAPELPELREPQSGWRRTPWGVDEARDCALRFISGDSLEGLSQLTRRSPRAIRARLAFDGIIATPGCANKALQGEV